MSQPQLRRVMGTRDVVLFYVVAVTGSRWIAVAAASGPSALAVWVIAGVGMFLPLAFTVLELSSRYPEEGGIYVWTKRAFGEFGGFITGWMYWASNLVYFPGLLYFAVGNGLYIAGASGQALSDSPAYFIVASLAGLAVALGLNLVGLDFAKWLHNIGALGTWIPTMVLIVMGLIAWMKFGSATDFSLPALVPSTRLQDIIFWSTIAFAFGGLETASLMGEEIKDARRTIPRAIAYAGVIITGIYVMGTVAILLALPHNEVSGLQGIMQAITKAGERIGFTGLGPVAAALITTGAIGGVGAWTAASGRLPFVAGIDRFLPPAFGRLHPRWKTPYVALLVQGSIAALFVVLGQAGTTVRGAYSVLVSMGVISFFIPYLIIFASLIKVQREPAAPGVIRVPGGRPVATLVGGVGFFTTAASIVLAVIPSEDAGDKTLAVIKVVGMSLLLLGAGLVIYAMGKARQRAGVPAPAVGIEP